MTFIPKNSVKQELAPPAHAFQWRDAILCVRKDAESLPAVGTAAPSYFTSGFLYFRFGVEIDWEVFCQALEILIPGEDSDFPLHGAGAYEKIGM